MEIEADVLEGKEEGVIIAIHVDCLASRRSFYANV